MAIYPRIYDGAQLCENIRDGNQGIVAAHLVLVQYNMGSKIDKILSISFMVFVVVIRMASNEAIRSNGARDYGGLSSTSYVASDLKERSARASPAAWGHFVIASYKY